MNIPNVSIINLIDYLSDNHRYYAFSKYCPRSLLDVLLRSGPLSELNVARLFNQIVQGVKYIHDSNIVHCDLILENILISKDYDTGIKSGPSSIMSSSTVCNFNYLNILKSGSVNVIPNPTPSSII